MRGPDRGVRPGAAGQAVQAQGEEAAFLEIMAARRRFDSHTDPEWSAPVDAETSWRRVQEWMRRAGYRDATCRG